MIDMLAEINESCSSRNHRASPVLTRPKVHSKLTISTQLAPFPVGYLLSNLSARRWPGRWRRQRSFPTFPRSRRGTCPSGSMANPRGRRSVGVLDRYVSLPLAPSTLNAPQRIAGALRDVQEPAARRHVDVRGPNVVVARCVALAPARRARHPAWYPAAAPDSRVSLRSAGRVLPSSAKVVTVPSSSLSTCTNLLSLR